MDGLAGDLGTMPINDLVLYLANRNLTGTLVVEAGNTKKSVSIRQGVIINAASNDPREYLGQFLINFGHITEDQLVKAFQTQTETKIFLGRILVMINVITEEVLRQVLTIKFRETLLGLMRWRGGFFKFARDVLPPDEDGVKVEVPLFDIHREGEFRETAWEAMLQIFTKGSLCLKVDESKVPRDLPQGSLDAQLFVLMREGQTIDEICLRMHATDFHLYQRLYALFRQGQIAPIDSRGEVAAAPPRAKSIGEELPAEQILTHAREYLAAGQFADAEKLATRAAEIHSTPEVQTLLKEAEAGLLVLLRNQLINTPRIPGLLVAPNQFKDYPLTPAERYLLSRIDGIRDIRAIIRVSPIREVDALKSFVRFVEQGLISLQ